MPDISDEEWAEVDAMAAAQPEEFWQLDDEHDDFFGVEHDESATRTTDRPT